MNTRVKAVRLMALAAMSEAAWIAQCPPESIPGADVERADRKGNRARDLLNSADCNPDRSTVEARKNDYDT